jgi:hypothetical protein
MSRGLVRDMSVELEHEVPAFNVAVNQLEKFLAGQNISPEFIWLFREDVVWRKRLFHVREPLPAENKRIAESLYERGRQRDLGIRLEVLCLLGSRPCCYVWLPKDRGDAEENGLLMSKLIMSFPTDLNRAEPVANPLMWRLYRLLAGEAPWISNVERLPCRNI